MLEAVGSVLTNKYAEGYPGHRYYGGCEWVDEVEQLAIDRAKELFGADHANVQPHAGGPANMAAYFALIEPGDADPGPAPRPRRPPHPRAQGQLLRPALRRAPYGVRREDSLIDFDEMRRLAHEVRPKLIVAGASAYPRVIDAARFREIADEVGAMVMVDMAHFAGLVAAGLHPNPVEHADVVTSTTHKTLAGPRAGLVLSPRRARQGGRPGGVPGAAGRPAVPRRRGQGGLLQDRRRARASATTSGRSSRTREALAQTPDGRRPASCSPTAPTTTCCSSTCAAPQWSGKDAEERLHEVAITVNRNTVPYDERPPTIASGVRIGTPAATMRGLDEDDMREVGGDHPGDA